MKMKPIDRRSTSQKQQNPFILYRAVASAAILLISFSERTGLSYLLQLVVSFLLTVIAAPILGIFFIIIPLYKRLIQKLVDVIYPEERLEIINNYSLRTALSTWKSPGVITCAMLMNQIPNINEVREIIEKTIYTSVCRKSNALLQNNASNLTKILTTRLGCDAWTFSKDFKIEDLIYVNTSKYYNDNFHEERLHEYINELTFNRLPKKRPPWRIITIPMIKQFSSTKSCAIVFQYHQLLSKEFSCILDSFVCGSKTVKLFPVSYRFKPTGHANLDSIMKQSMYCLNIIRTLGSVPLMLFREFITWSSNTHPRSVRNRQFEAVAWSESMPITLIDEIKDKIGLGIKQSDVLLSCIGGALRQYFTMMEGNIPDDVLSVLPVYPLRPISLGEENPLGCLSLKLPLHEVDPIQRLKLLKRRLQKSKDDHLFYDSTRLLICYLPRVLPFFLTKLVANLFTEKYPIVISNDYLNVNPSVFWNCKVGAFYYWRPAIANIGLSLSLIRYKNAVTLTATSRSSFLQRPDLLMSCFVREVKDLALNLGIKNIRGVPTS